MNFTISSCNSRRFVFPFLLCLIVLLGTAFIYRMGFHAMAVKADKAPERLRDFTFPVWHAVSWLKHGFLTFLAADSFAKREAYANHSTLYLLFMWGLYQLQQVSAVLTMRVTGAILAMLASVTALWFAVRRDVARSEDFRSDVLLLAAFGYFLTLPGFWISLGKFNVDNGFVFVFPLLLLTSVTLERSGAASRVFWAGAIFLSLLMPIASALFSVFMLGMAVFEHACDKRRIAASLLLAAVSIVLYLEPVLAAKTLGFANENSSWLFRSGLDGDMHYYGNFIDSVVLPYFNRPWYLIAFPATLLLLQTVYCRWLEGAAGRASDGSHRRIMLHVFSVYILMLLFWPQSVSIHPYLYDALLVGPLAAWVIMNFALKATFRKHFVFWLVLLLFLIQFNLTKIAQAGRCMDCYFPAWGLLGIRGG